MKRWMGAGLVAFFFSTGILFYHFAVAEPTADTPVTFSNQVARVLQANCQSCHRAGGVAPFALITYQDALPMAEAMKLAVTSRRMPQGRTLRVDTGCTDETQLDGPRQLKQSEIQTIVDWVDAGAPEGNRSDLPAPVKFDDNVTWKIGEPDVIFPNDPNGFTIPAGVARDVFRNFVVHTNFDVDRYITAVEFHPGAQPVGIYLPVHHAHIFIDTIGEGANLEKEFAKSNPEIPGPGYESENSAGLNSLTTPLEASWFPGSPPVFVRSGTAILVPKGADIILQVHYVRTDRINAPINDKTVVGLRFTHEPIFKEKRTFTSTNQNFRIPAGDPHYLVNATKLVPGTDGITIEGLTPHAHKLATDHKTEAILPSGEAICLSDVAYDVEHQATYGFKKPVTVPAGTTIKVSVFYDNSENNPDQAYFPPIDIPWGRTAEREMCHTTVSYTDNAKTLTPSTPAIISAKIQDSVLRISGTDLRAGAFIEVNGVFLRDTKIKANKKGTKTFAISSQEWKNAFPKRADATVVIVNNDGGRSNPVLVTRD